MQDEDCTGGELGVIMDSTGVVNLAKHIMFLTKNDTRITFIDCH